MDLFNVKRREDVATFASLDNPSFTEEQRRELEMQVLRPSRLPKYDVPPATAETKLDYYVKVYFDTMEELQEFSSLVKVARMTERTTRDSKRILAALKAHSDQ